MESFAYMQGTADEEKTQGRPRTYSYSTNEGSRNESTALPSFGGPQQRSDCPNPLTKPAVLAAGADCFDRGDSVHSNIRESLPAAETTRPSPIPSKTSPIIITGSCTSRLSWRRPDAGGSSLSGGESQRSIMSAESLRSINSALQEEEDEKQQRQMMDELETLRVAEEAQEEELICLALERSITETSGGSGRFLFNPDEEDSSVSSQHDRRFPASPSNTRRYHTRTVSLPKPALKTSLRGGSVSSLPGGSLPSTRSLGETVDHQHRHSLSSVDGSRHSASEQSRAAPLNANAVDLHDLSPRDGPDYRRVLRIRPPAISSNLADVDSPPLAPALVRPGTAVSVNSPAPTHPLQRPQQERQSSTPNVNNQQPGAISVISPPFSIKCARPRSTHSLTSSAADQGSPTAGMSAVSVHSPALETKSPEVRAAIAAHISSPLAAEGSSQRDPSRAFAPPLSSPPSRQRFSLRTQQGSSVPDATGSTRHVAVPLLKSFSLDKYDPVVSQASMTVNPGTNGETVVTSLEILESAEDNVPQVGKRPFSPHEEQVTVDALPEKSHGKQSSDAPCIGPDGDVTVCPRVVENVRSAWSTPQEKLSVAHSLDDDWPTLSNPMQRAAAASLSSSSTTELAQPSVSGTFYSDLRSDSCRSLSSAELRDIEQALRASEASTSSNAVARETPFVNEYDLTGAEEHLTEDELVKIQEALRILPEVASISDADGDAKPAATLPSIHISEEDSEAIAQAVLDAEEEEAISRALREADEEEERKSLELVFKIQQEENEIQYSLSGESMAARQRLQEHGNVRSMTREDYQAQFYERNSGIATGSTSAAKRVISSELDEDEEDIMAGFRMNSSIRQQWSRGDHNSIVGPNREVRTKHDTALHGQTNAHRLGFEPDEVASVSNQAYNSFVHSVRATKKGVAMKGTGRAGSDTDATKGGAMDPKVRAGISRAINNEIIEKCNGVVKEGKEAVVYHADKGAESGGFDVAVKVFKKIQQFRGRGDYVDGDPRFGRSTFRNLSSRDQLELWADKEFRNLIRANKACVPVPIPLLCKENIVFMRFLGDDGWPAPQLRELELRRGSNRWFTLYTQVVEAVRR